MKSKFFLFFTFAFINCNAQKIYLNSIPKSGTHLALNCLMSLTKKGFFNLGKDLVVTNQLPKNKSMLLWHIKYSETSAQNLQKNNFKGIYIYRDPRDKIVSAAYWILKHPYLLKAYGFDINNKPTVQELITKLIPITKNEYNQYAGWLKVPFFCSFKFEDLVGPKGGGNKTKQLETIVKICNHLKIKPEIALVNNCIKNLFGKSYSFREGKIGGWKKHFSKDHIKLVKEQLGQLLMDLGYEKDLNW